MILRPSLLPLTRPQVGARPGSLDFTSGDDLTGFLYFYGMM